MRKSRLSLLMVAIVIAAILFAGCTSPTQTSPQIASTNASTSSTTAAASSSVASASPTVAPSSSTRASPTSTPTPTPTPTSTPQPSGKIATSIFGTATFNSNPTITRGLAVSWGFEVVPTGSIGALSVPVTVKIDNKAIGQVTPEPGTTETVAFSLTSAQTNSLAAGQHTLTVSFAGNSEYQPSVGTFSITVT
jgi:hypothetical protein